MALADLRAWLVGAPHVDDGGVSLVRGLADRLRAHGMPLWRASGSLMTKHPELLWLNVQWTEEGGIKCIERPYAVLATPFYQRSPVAALVAGAPPIHVRLVDGPLPYPICEDLRAQGGTDYLAQGLHGPGGGFSYVSWATRAPGGFADDDVAMLIALMPELALRFELASAQHTTRALLEVYLGKNAAQRVADGAFRRGGGEMIDAAIWFCDLRGFSAMSDERSPQEVVRTLDAYFERVAGAVMERGGEVLKFIGDAVLAIFPIAPGDDGGAACREALEAARLALTGLAELNARRLLAGDPALAIGVALHRGQVMYGNIGARDRLDFTVISSAVNEATRLEGLCKPLGVDVAMSAAFVDAARPDGLVDLGPHAVKGVRAPLHVFTLAHADHV